MKKMITRFSIIAPMTPISIRSFLPLLYLSIHAPENSAHRMAGIVVMYAVYVPSNQLRNYKLDKKL